jgi:hypothetical protein
LCDESTINATDCPTEIARFVGVNDKPLFLIVPEEAIVVDVVVLTVVVVIGAAVVVELGATRAIVLVDDFAR